MQQTLVADRENGYIRAKVERSTKLKAPFAVTIDINDHYVVGDPEKVAGCAQAVGIVNDRFQDSMNRSEWIIDQVMALSGKTKDG